MTISRLTRFANFAIDAAVTIAASREPKHGFDLKALRNEDGDETLASRRGP
jgi:hypothetical protein